MEAIEQATAIHNRLPTESNDDGKSPWETLFKETPDLSEIRIFGSHGYARKIGLQAQFAKKDLSKSKAIKCRYIGYEPGSRGHRLWTPSTNKVVCRNKVIFMEDLKPPSKSNPNPFNCDNRTKQFEDKTIIEKEDDADRKSYFEQCADKLVGLGVK